MLGSNIVRELIQQGYHIKALVQAGRGAETIKDLPNVQLVEGDLTEAQQILDSMAGCEYVIHVAAFAASWPTRSPKYFEVNVDGTQHMIDAALAHQVKRFVHISSSNTQGFTESKQEAGTEETPWCGDQGMDYLLTKRLSHEMVETAVADRELPALLICPAFMIGEYDAGPTSGQLLVRAWNDPLSFCTSGGKNFVAARDVAKAAVNALKMGRIGETYICGHTNLEFREFFKQIEDVTGKPQPKLVVPGLLVKIMGWVMGLIGRIFRKQPLMTLPMARSACARMYYQQKKAIRELNMPQTDLRVAIRDAYRWFGQHQYLNNYELHETH